MKTIKCQRCGNEFDNYIYPYCPECFRKPTMKERIIDHLWRCIASVLALTILGFALYGISIVLGDNALFLGLALLFVFPYSLDKIYEMKKDKIMTRLNKELKKLESENDILPTYNITNAVRDELKLK